MPKAPCGHCALIINDGQWNCMTGSSQGFYLWVQIKQLCHQREGFFWLPEFCQVSCCQRGSDIYCRAQLPNRWPEPSQLCSQHCIFTPCSSCLWSRESQYVWPCLDGLRGLFLHSVHHWQHQVKHPNISPIGLTRVQDAALGGGNSVANTQQCGLFCCGEAITTWGCHWEQWQLRSKSS